VLVDHQTSSNIIKPSGLVKMEEESTPDKKERKQKKKIYYDVEPGVEYGVAPFPSWPETVCNCETSIMRDRGPSTTTTITFFCR